MNRAEDMVAKDAFLERARAELRRAGLFDKDADYGQGEIADCVLKLLSTWYDQGHSGGSAGMTLKVFDRLVRHKRLAPIKRVPGRAQRPGSHVKYRIKPMTVDAVLNVNTDTFTVTLPNGTEKLLSRRAFEKAFEIIDPQPLNPIVKLWAIPPGTRADKCEKCPATIFMVPNADSGKPMPLAVAPELETKGFGVVATLARKPTAQEEGFGYSHFSDCPAAAHFRKKGTTPLKGPEAEKLLQEGNQI